MHYILLERRPSPNAATWTLPIVDQRAGTANMGTLRLLVFFGAALPALFLLTLAQAQTEASPGERLAREVCAECHAVELGSFWSPNPDAPAFQELADTPGINPMTIRVWLQSPHRTMPLLVLDEAEIDDISTYILSLEQLSP